ncbi:pilus assembly protein FimV [Pseudomonas duriflava]|uniref:Pilus assembly protein FimV n=1 Tax=Pseudomonas duriflava TaxID=459528 RepID=A0A562Q8K4_9PSED|nr:FimV/HubP family polar landmark protein [Pseudomonas duriflava]TWI53087.1 pilus assembly protein FimV [Pseudomonas duriflava]
MVRVRKLVLAIAAASAFASGSTYGLGLGEIHLNSALNQPFNATVDLTDVRDLSAQELRPLLASPDDFNKAGIDRNYFLTDLKFTPEVRPDGRSVIRITSSKPVREPYLNFLMEVTWPSGRVLREYTVLLDPPLYTPQRAAAPVAPVTVPSPIPRASPRSTTAPAGSAGSPAIMDGEYMTSPKDTLWEVADRTRPNDSVSVHQMMLAIQDRNPNAFLSNNINLLKSGQVLRLPNEEQVRVRSQQQALEEVAAQNRAWRGGLRNEGGQTTTPPRQLDATNRAPTEQPSSVVDEHDNLRLLSGQAGQSVSGSDQGNTGTNQALADKLAITQESLDSTRRENEELKSRMGDLQSQLDKLQKLMQLKDAQLARLQANMANPPESQNAPGDTPATENAQVPTTPEPSAEQPVSVPQAPDENPPPSAEASEEAAPEPVPNETLVGNEAAETEITPAPLESSETPETPVSAPSAVQVTPQPVAPAAPVASPVASEEPEPAGFLNDILSNSLWLGLIGGSALLALLVLLMVNSRRNAMREAEREAALEEEQSVGAFRVDPDVHEHSLDGLDLGDLSDTSFDQAADDKTTSDALGQADIYMAYGRFNQAADVLQKASDEEPHRTDLRLKLMEVYAEMGDRDGFVRQENELREIGGSQSEVEQLKSRYPDMAAAAAATALGAAALAAAHEVSESEKSSLEQASQEKTSDDDFDLNFDDFDFDKDDDKSMAVKEPGFTLETSSIDSQPAASPEAPLENNDFDFSLDFNEPSKEEPVADASALNDEFSLDLDEPLLTDDSDKNVPDQALHQPEDEFNLDFGRDASAVQHDQDLSHDFDLSLDESETLPEEPSSLETSVEEAPLVQEDSFEAQLQRANEDLTRQGEADENVPQVQEESRQEPFGVVDTSEKGLDDDFDFLSGEDETATKLDLARAYIDMGDADGARDILDEVLSEGSDAQRNEAREMLAQLS